MMHDERQFLLPTDQEVRIAITLARDLSSDDTKLPCSLRHSPSKIAGRTLHNAIQVMHHETRNNGHLV